MNIKKIFESCVDIEPFDEECYTLLNKVMTISSPMKFDSEFVSDEQLDRLEAELDRFNIRSAESDILKNTIQILEPYKTSDFIFI